MSARVLLVDDEEDIVEPVAYALRQQGFEVDTAGDGERALERARSGEYDLLICDVMLPGMLGTDVCRIIRGESTLPVILLTARDAEVDRVLGLELGADDYVTKPFSSRELLARVKANMRRHATAPAQETKGANVNDIVIGDLTIHPDSYMVTKRDEKIELTHREFELIHYLAQNIGQVMTREHLLQTVWGYDYFGDVRTVDVTVRRLREKVEDNPSTPSYIITRRGVGYYLKAGEED